MKTLRRYFRSLVAATLLLPVWAVAGPVDINSADAKTLARELQGIGLSRAQAIVDYREKNGPFKTAADLSKVKGIGMKVVETNRDNIRLGATSGGDKAKSEKADKAEGN